MCQEPSWVSDRHYLTVTSKNAGRQAPAALLGREGSCGLGTKSLAQGHTGSKRQDEDGNILPVGIRRKSSVGAPCFQCKHNLTRDLWLATTC